MGFATKLKRWSTPFTGLLGRDSGQREATYRAADPAGGSLYQFLNSLADPVWIKDRDHRYTFANDAFAKSVRIPYEALIGATHAELLERWPHSRLETRPEAIAAITAQDSEAMTKDLPTETLDEIRQSSGKPLWMHKRKAALRDEHHRVIGMIALARDVTLEKLAERESLEITDNLSQTLQETVSMTEGASQIVRLGWCRWLHQEERFKSVDEIYAGIHGYTVGEFMSLFASLEADHSLVHPDDQDAVMEYYETTDYTKTASQEYRIINRVGDIVHIREVSTPIEIRDGKIIESLSTIQDVTAFKLIEQHLQEQLRKTRADKQLSETILSNVTQELRLPLTSISGCLEALDHSELAVNELRQYGMVEKSVSRMETLIEDLLQMSTLGSTTPSPAKAERYSIEKLVYGLVTTALPQAENADVKLNVELDIEQDIAIGPRNEILICLRKYLENAFKFAAGGKVSIRVTTEDLAGQSRKIRFSVIDDGVGIAPEHTGKVFDAFYQSDHSTNRKFEGAGLGLAVVQLLVTAMGGEFGVDSRPGQGSQFWFSVPLDTQAPTSQS